MLSGHTRIQLICALTGHAVKAEGMQLHSKPT